jgi:hypothetical protein
MERYDEKSSNMYAIQAIDAILIADPFVPFLFTN